MGTLLEPTNASRADAPATKLDAMPGVIGIPVGAFFDPTFPAPNVVVWCDSKAEWMEFPGGVLQLPDQTPPVATR